MNQPLTVEEIRNRIVEVRKLRFGDVANHPRNPKKHGDNQRQAFRGSVRELGFASVPIVYHSDRNGGKLTFADGHLRGSEVADYVGDVAILDIDDAEADKLLLYADPIAAMAEYESQQLDSLLRDVQTGDDALQKMLAGLAEEAGLYPDKTPVADPGPQIDKADELRQKWGVESGDLWILGNHRLICGDCTDKATVERVMGGERARLCHTDPPYGVDYANTLGGRRNQKIGGWAEIENDALADDALEEFLFKSLSLTDALVLLCWHPWRRVEVFLRAIRKAGWKPNAEIVWVKNALVFGRSDYQWRHECCVYAKREGAGRQEDRKQTTVWEFDKTIDAMHPTQKPVGLFEIALNNHTAVGDVVYEPFSGSGSQIIACEQLGRQCRAVEISPAYCAVVLERWSTATNAQPVRVEA